jgi:hypothetical protein
MRKAAAVWAIVILGVMGGAAAAQNNSQGKTEIESAVKTTHAYRLDFSVNELEEGKKINSRQYSLNLNAGDANEIKIGTRVPVEAGHEQFEYLDVGTSIWCKIGESADGIPLAVRADISNFAVPDQGTGHESRPVIRQLRINASTLAVLGKPMLVGSV